MTAVARENPPPRIASPTAPIFLWLLVQLIALLIAANDLPLSARYPQPAHLLAIEVMLAVQTAAAGLLFPWVLRDVRAGVLAVLSAWVFVVLAGAMSAVGVNAIFAAASFSTLWMIALWLWNRALSGEAAKRVAVAVAVLLSAGGVMLYYVAIEFGEGSYARGNFGVLLAGLDQPRRPWSNAAMWLTLTSLAVAAIVARAIRRRPKTA